MVLLWCIVKYIYFYLHLVLGQKQTIDPKSSPNVGPESWPKLQYDTELKTFSSTAPFIFCFQELDI